VLRLALRRRQALLERSERLDDLTAPRQLEGRARDQALRVGLLDLALEAGDLLPQPALEAVSVEDRDRLVLQAAEDRLCLVELRVQALDDALLIARRRCQLSGGSRSRGLAWIDEDVAPAALALELEAGLRDGLARFEDLLAQLLDLRCVVRDRDVLVLRRRAIDVGLHRHV